jgi:hypothetical protein
MMMYVAQNAEWCVSRLGGEEEKLNPDESLLNRPLVSYVEYNSKFKFT